MTFLLVFVVSVILIGISVHFSSFFPFFGILLGDRRVSETDVRGQPIWILFYPFFKCPSYYRYCWQCSLQKVYRGSVCSKRYLTWVICPMGFNNHDASISVDGSLISIHSLFNKGASLILQQEHCLLPSVRNLFWNFLVAKKESVIGGF